MANVKPHSEQAGAPTAAGLTAAGAGVGSLGLEEGEISSCVCARASAPDFRVRVFRTSSGRS